jgi:hypothetical protein
MTQFAGPHGLSRSALSLAVRASVDLPETVSIALLSVDEPDLAARLDRCMTAHSSRHHGNGRPFSCQSAACVWCRRPMIHGWWTGICEWTDAMSSLGILSIGSSVGLPDAARHLRRALRDVRDRMARRRNPWHEVRIAGIIGGDRKAMVMVSHEGIDRSEIENVLRRRWPDVLVKKLRQEEPTWEMLPDDAAQLGRYRRGIEPVRLVIMPQQEQAATTSSLVGSMPVLVR